MQPQGGKHPTSALDGARNILIQDVCPGRTTTHIGTAVDSVSFAAFVDGIEHDGKGKQGAAKVARLPDDVCDHPYATGLGRGADDRVPQPLRRAGRQSERPVAQGHRRTEGPPGFQAGA